MKIYFGASISFNRDYLPKYQLIVRQIKKLGHQVLSEHVVDPKLKAGEGIAPKKLFEKEIKKIEKCDLMIAEVTQPSWGTAFLMEHALKHGKPILGLFYKDNGASIPAMIEGHPELYVESYDEDNLKTVLSFNLKHFNMKMKAKGKLVVLDGTNGSGKATQAELLMKYFKKNKIKAKDISFPRYYTSFHGKTICRFLKGEFGKLEDINPYLSSLAFALDRLTAKNQILNWLNNGYIIVVDRYITSNLAHQGAKLPHKERKKFINWIYDMEYKQHRMPKENIVVYLYVPPKISDKLILQRTKKRERDIEEGLTYQKKVASLYLKLCEKYKHWIKINCIDKKGNLKTKKEIHKLIIQALKEKNIMV